MISLYEKIDNLNKLTNNLTEKKEKIIKKMSPSVDNISIIYELGGIKIPISEIHSFNFYGIDDNSNKVIGYICFELDNIALGKFTIDYLSHNTVESAIVYLSDNTNEVYNINWSSQVEQINEKLYLLILKGQKKILQRN